MDPVRLAYKTVGRANKTAHMVFNNPNTQTLYTNASQDYIRDPMSDFISEADFNLDPRSLINIKEYQPDDVTPNYVNKNNYTPSVTKSDTQTYIDYFNKGKFKRVINNDPGGTN